MNAPKPSNDKIISSKEFNDVKDHYIKIYYTNNKDVFIICYNTQKLDGIKYKIKLNIQDIHNINPIFKDYNDIEEFFELIIGLINEDKISIYKYPDNNLLFSFTMPDDKKNDIKIDILLPKEKTNNPSEYIKVLSKVIVDLRDKNNDNTREIEELKEEMNKLKNLVLKYHNNEIKKNAVGEKCFYCQQPKAFKKCICKKYICDNCILYNENIKCRSECFLFNNNTNKLNSYYNISKFPLPKNFEAKIHFIKVDMIRVGITFDSNIINEKDGELDSPPYNIFYKSNGAHKFYAYGKGWINLTTLNKLFKENDYLIMKVRDGKLSYILNGEDLGNSYGLNQKDIDSKKMFLLIHRREEESQCELKYVCEILD